MISGNTIVVGLGASKYSTNLITKGKFNLQGDECRQNWISLFTSPNAWLSLSLFPKERCTAKSCSSSPSAYRSHIAIVTVLPCSGSQVELLFNTLGEPRVQTFSVRARTTTAVFVCLLLFRDERSLPLPTHLRLWFQMTPWSGVVAKAKMISHCRTWDWM